MTPYRDVRSASVAECDRLASRQLNAQVLDCSRVVHSKRWADAGKTLGNRSSTDRERFSNDKEATGYVCRLRALLQRRLSWLGGWRRVLARVVAGDGGAEETLAFVPLPRLSLAGAAGRTRRRRSAVGTVALAAQKEEEEGHGRDDATGNNTTAQGRPLLDDDGNKESSHHLRRRAPLHAPPQ